MCLNHPKTAAKILSFVSQLCDESWLLQTDGHIQDIFHYRYLIMRLMWWVRADIFDVKLKSALQIKY